MKTSDKIEALAAALVAAESEISDPKRDGTNPHFKSKYITLDSVIEATRHPLAKNGVRVVQSPGMNEIGLTVTTRLLHGPSGQWIEGEITMPISSNANAQAVGSAITYARRYALLSMLNLGGEDDDGNAAATAPKGRTQAKPQEGPSGPITVPVLDLANNPDIPGLTGIRVDDKTWYETKDVEIINFLKGAAIGEMVRLTLAAPNRKDGVPVIVKAEAV